MGEISTQIFWIFELGRQEGLNVPIWMIVGFQQRDWQDCQKFNNDTFYKPLVTSAECIIRTESYPDSGKFLNEDDEYYSLNYGQIKEAFRVLTIDDMLKQNISDNDFRSSNNINDIGCKLYVFDIRYQKKLENAQPIKVEFNFLENVPAGRYGYALVLPNKLATIPTDGQRQFDLT